MTDSDKKIIMTIRIGGERLQLSVPFDKQDAVRDAENAVRQLYDDRRKKLPKYTDREILAMVAYNFASLYQQLLNKHSEAETIALRCEKALSAIANVNDLKANNPKSLL